MVQIAVIGGSGVKLEGVEGSVEQAISTPYGTAGVILTTVAGKEIAFLPRHGLQRNTPPHLINYRANIAALKSLGVRGIFAGSAVGSLTKRLQPGSMAIVTDFLDFTKARPSTFFDQPGELVHTDFSIPYSVELNSILVTAAEDIALELRAPAVYVCAEGPRYETPAEIRMFSQLGGDLVGMTGVPEVVLAREAGIPYACVATVTNWAAGISERPLDHQDVLQMMGKRGEDLRALFTRAIELLPVE